MVNFLKQKKELINVVKKNIEENAKIICGPYIYDNYDYILETRRGDFFAVRLDDKNWTPNDLKNLIDEDADYALSKWEKQKREDKLPGNGNIKLVILTFSDAEDCVEGDWYIIIPVNQIEISEFKLCDYL